MEITSTPMVVTTLESSLILIKVQDNLSLIKKSNQKFQLSSFFQINEKSYYFKFLLSSFSKISFKEILEKELIAISKFYQRLKDQKKESQKSQEESQERITRKIELPFGSFILFYQIQF